MDDPAIDPSTDPASELRFETHGTEQVTFLPVDGPVRSIERAATGLRTRSPDQPRRWVIPATENRTPPSPALLSILRDRRLQPGVDLRVDRWVTQDGILWTNDETIALLAIPVAGSHEMQPAACLVRSLRGFVAASPSGEWITERARGSPASPRQWAEILTAHYIDMAAKT